MPHYCYLEAELRCPFCDTFVTDRLWFQWGFSPGYSPREHYVYHLGDAIQWKSCQGDSTPSWTYFFEVGQPAGANLGDPSFHNLIIRDSAQFWLKEPCKNCQQRLGGAAIEIRDGAIQRTWIYKPNELDDQVDIYLIGSKGDLKPMEDWNDHHMARLTDCSPSRLVTIHELQHK